MTQDSNLWQQSNGEAFIAQTLHADQRVDLAVIGGGFTGCAAALHAANQGASVCLLEAENIGHGGSGRNVGLVNAGLWMPPDEIIAILGEPAGERLIKALGDAPRQVFDLIDRHRIDCAPIRQGTLHLAHNPAGQVDLQSRFRQGNRFGAPLQLLGKAETARRTGSTAYLGALWDPRAGTIQPLAYCTGLARAAQSQGAKIFTDAPARRITREGEDWVVEAAGQRITAKALLVATNAYHRDLTGVPPPAFTPVHYSQFATDPLPEALRARLLPGGEGCWDTAKVMSSFRVDASGRLIMGGMGNQAGLGAAIHHGWARRKLRQIFPELDEVCFAHRWSGQIAMTADHLPKLVAFGPNALMIYGYSGRGIAPGTVCGTAAARALLSGNHETLPLPVTPAYHERFRQARAAFFESGFTAAHLIGARLSR